MSQTTPEGRFPNWDGIWSFEPGSVTDLWALALGVIVFGFTIYIAIKQLNLMKRQMAIIENEHKIMEAQLSKKAQMLMLQDRQWKDDADPTTYGRIQIRNIGNKTAHTFSWDVLLPAALYNSGLMLRDLNYRELPATFTQIGQGRFTQITSRYDGRLLAGDGVDVALLDITHNQPPIDSFQILWQVRCEDGPAPAKGYGTMTFTHTNNLYYRVNISAAPSEMGDV